MMLLAYAVLTYISLALGSNGIEMNQEVVEYCNGEDFQAACLKNEVVIMKSAVFGRMTMGRCLQDEGDFMLKKYGNDPNYFGCSINVLDLVDAKCSGRNLCTVKFVGDIEQKVQKPCLPALKNYLEASFDCINVIEPDRTCTVSVTSNPQHITTVNSSTKLSCGSRHQPWKLEAPAGQQINVSLLDFGGLVNQLERDCLQYGYIIDREATKNISICGRVTERLRPVYQSTGNNLYIFLVDSVTKHHNVLLKVYAVGCTDLVPPEDMWLRRRNHEAVVGCYSSRQIWYLNCVNNQWLGVIGNCTREFPQLVVGEMKTGTTSIKPTVLAAAVIVFIGLAICAVIIICGLVCIKRYNSKIAKASYNYNVNSAYKGKDQQLLVSRERFRPPILQQAE